MKLILNLQRTALKNKKVSSLGIQKPLFKAFSSSEGAANDNKVKLEYKLAELEALEREPVSKDWFYSILSKAQESSPEIFEKLTMQIDHLYESREELPLLRKELESVRQINKLNHEKVTIVRHKIEDLDKEMNTMQTRISKEIQQEKENALKTFASDAVQLLNELKAAEKDLNIIISEAQGKEGSEALQSFIEGFKMIENHGSTIFKKFDIYAIEAAPGAVFNKSLHQVVGLSNDKAHHSGTIKAVTHPGYLMGKNVLQKARVLLND